MKALSKRLHTSATLEGDILYNEQAESAGKFLVPKIVDYIEQGDYHAATLTVEETLKYAWMSSTAGHHSYGQTHNDVSKSELDSADEHFITVSDILC